MSTGIITTVAGYHQGELNGYSGDGGPATSALLNSPQAIAIDATGSLFIVDSNNERVRIVTSGAIATVSTPTITTVSASAEIVGVGQLETFTATVTSPAGTPSGGTVTFSDGSTVLGKALLVNGKTAFSTTTLAVGFHVITAVFSGGGGYLGSSSTGIGSSVSPLSLIETVAGVPPGVSPGYNGDGIPATTAQLTSPNDVAVDANGDVFIADTYNNRIREVNAKTHVISTIAGTGAIGYSGDGGSAIAAQLSYPMGVAVDGAGDVFIADFGNSVIRKISASTGVITTVAGNGTIGYNGDGIPATSAELWTPQHIAVDSSGNLFIVDGSNSRIREVDAKTGLISTVAGNGTNGAYNGDGIPATSANLPSLQYVTVDSSGDLFIVADNRILEVTSPTSSSPNAGIITTVAGGGQFNGDGIPATSASIYAPVSVAVDPLGDIFFTDWGQNGYLIREVSASTKLVNTIAGAMPVFIPPPYDTGDGGPANLAHVGAPLGMAVDSNGDLFFSDVIASVVREIYSGGIGVSVIPGNKLVFAQPLPSSLIAGSATGLITINVEDKSGNVQTGDNSTTLTLYVNNVAVATTTDVNGVATFAAQTLTKAGNNSIRVTSSPVLTPAVASIKVTPNVPDHLAFTVQPAASVVAGKTLANVSVAIEDIYNNIVTTDGNPVSLTVNTLTGGPTGGASALASGPTIVTANGVTTFSNMSFDSTGTYTLSGSDSADSLATITSRVITITPAPATSMVVQQGLPASGTAGLALAPPVQLAFYDQFQNLVTNDTSLVTITVTIGGTFSNGHTTTSIHPVKGVASFPSLIFTQAATYTLVATDPEATLLNGSGTANLGSVVISPNAPSKLVFVPALPTTLVAGGATGPITVQVEDKYGNLEGSDNGTILTLYVNNVAVIPTTTDANGVATFPSQKLTKTGMNSIRVTSNPVLTPAVASIKVTSNVPDHLAFTVQPAASIVAGKTLANVSVAIEDAFNNIVTSDQNPVGLSVNTLTGGPTGNASALATGPAIVAANGVTTFSNMSFDSTGTYALSGADIPDSLATITSHVITITPDAATSMVVQQGLPATGTAGVALAPPVQLAFYDQFQNLVTNDTSLVTITVTTGGTFSNGQTTTSIHPVKGVASFPSMVFTTASTYTLVATDPEATLLNGSGTANLGSVVISPAAPYKLAFVSPFLPPTTVLAGAPSTPVRVQVEDKYGNFVTGSVISVTEHINNVNLITLPLFPFDVLSTGTPIFTKAGINSLSFTSSPTLIPAVASILVTPSTPDHLAFTVQPTASVVAGKTLANVSVAVEDVYNNIVTTDNNPVALVVNTLTGGPTGGANALASGPTSVTANGVTTFSNMSFDSMGTYTLSGSDTADSLATITSRVITITPAAATSMVVEQGPPSSGAAGVALAPAVQLAFYDQFQNLVTNDTSLVTITVTTGGTFSNGQTTTTAHPVKGVASFPSLIFNQAATYTLVATDPEATLLNGSGTANLGTVLINPAAPYKFAFTSPLPTTLVAGGSTGPISFTVEDKYGNTAEIPPSQLNVFLFVNNVYGTEWSTNSASEFSVSAVFLSQTLTKTGTNSIRISTELDPFGLVLVPATASIKVTPNVPDHLAFTVQPAASVVAGKTLANVSVAVEDVYNNIVTTDNNPVTLTVNTLAGGPPGGANALATGPTIVTANGVTTFSNMSFDSMGTYTLSGSDSADSLATITSGVIVITPAAATSMVVKLALPASGTAGVALAPPVQFAFYDQYGNLATNDTSTLTLTITNSGNFSTGQNSVSLKPSRGIATFNSLIFNQAGAYSLMASDPEASLTNGTVVLGSITIAPAAASQLVFQPALPATLAEGGSTGPIVVQIEDKFGNLISTDGSTTVTLNVNGVTVATTSDAGGIASFGSQILTKLGNNIITATSIPLLKSVSATIVVS